MAHSPAVGPASRRRPRDRPRPRVAAGALQEGEAGNGREFLVMHRAMIELIRAAFPDRAALFAGWAAVPTPERLGRPADRAPQLILLCPSGPLFNPLRWQAFAWPVVIEPRLLVPS